MTTKAGMRCGFRHSASQNSTSPSSRHHVDVVLLEVRPSGLGSRSSSRSFRVWHLSQPGLPNTMDLIGLGHRHVLLATSAQFRLSSFRLLVRRFDRVPAALARNEFAVALGLVPVLDLAEVAHHAGFADDAARSRTRRSCPCRPRMLWLAVDAVGELRRDGHLRGLRAEERLARSAARSTRPTGRSSPTKAWVMAPDSIRLWNLACLRMRSTSETGASAERCTLLV